MESPSKDRKQPAAVTIRQASEPGDIDEVRKCFQVYTTWLDEDISFQNFDAEFQGLPGKYAPPSGALLLALDSNTGAILGCVAMRPLHLEQQYLSQRQFDAPLCEMKRLFVYPEARGRQVSRALVREVVKRAAEAGYDEILLDTLGKMQAAINLYISEGFEETAPYTFNSLEGAMFFTKKLKVT
ncbi:unnamed protein product [Clonostachys rhizophaga]|uniref:N-acetyltransferase domain-containing protein n=1 Tax=Clonostachys rhizophaga TaxID=160324 RepID=A0A9N9VXK5_9HYPO|nr:unnamed protein product [Clonostachys rhizophaga]